MTPKFFGSLRDMSKWMFLAKSGTLARSAQETLMASELFSLFPAPENR